MSKIKFVMFVTLIATLFAYAPVAAFTPAPPLPGIEGPGGVPHYFGPFGNWAFSPLPRGPVAACQCCGRRHRVQRHAYSDHRRCVYYADDTG